MSAATVLACLCGCPKGAHKQGKKACNACGVCDTFELDGEVPAVDIGGGVVAVGPAAPAVAKAIEAVGKAAAELEPPALGEAFGGPPAPDPRGPSRPPGVITSGADIPIAVPGGGVRVCDDPNLCGESTSAALRRVEAERDELRIRLTNEYQATLALLDRRDVELRLERDAQVKLRQRLTASDAELASARTELEQLRRELADVTQDRDGLRHLCERMERAAGIAPDGDPFDPSDDFIARLRAERDQLRARVDQLVAETERLRAERQKLPEIRLDAAHAGLKAAADVLVTFPMHACEVCGARYGKPYTDHPCGRLTPVVVTVTRKEPSA